MLRELGQTIASFLIKISKAIALDLDALIQVWLLRCICCDEMLILSGLAAF